MSTGQDEPLATWATLAFVDIVESVLHAHADEAGWVHRLRRFMADAAGLVALHRGDLIERRGDGLLIRFDRPHEACACVLALHRLAAQAPVPSGQSPLQLRAGVHHAQVWCDDQGVYGQGVNLAARVAALAGVGQTLVTAPVRDLLIVGVDAEVLDLGDCHLKHVDGTVRLFSLGHSSAAPLPGSLQQAVARRLRTKPALALLPLQPSGHASSGPHAIGVAEVVHDQLLRRMSTLPVVHVFSGQSTLAWSGRSLDPDLVYRRLGADYLLQGEVEDLGDAGVRLGMQLWRRGAGEPVAHCTRRASVAEVLSPDSELYGQLVQELGGRIVTLEQRAAGAAAALPNMASHTLYLQAVAALHRFSRDEFERARQMLETLAERAPRHPDPLAWMARWHVFNVVQGWSGDRTRDAAQAFEFSQRALDRDPTSSLALTMAGSVMAGVRADPQEASRYYDQALENNPNESLAWLMKAVAHGFLDQSEAALRSSELALGLSPLDPVYDFYCSLSASASLAAGDLERAVSLAELAIRKNRSHGSSYRTLCIAAYRLGDPQRARQAIEDLLCVEPHASVSLFRARAPGNHPLHDAFAEALRRSGLPED